MEARGLADAEITCSSMREPAAMTLDADNVRWPQAEAFAGNRLTVTDSIRAAEPR